MLREDGTGAIEYFYGKMGEATKTRRTLIVPNQAIATYVTQWTYDSHNRLLEMIYPDEEKITYPYNLGGQLEKVHGYKSYGYDYVSKIGYDKFEQRIYLKYCNGAETFYTISYHAYIPLLKFNNIVMNKIIKILSSIICFFCFVIYEFIDYFNDFLFFLPNLPESFTTEKKWEKILCKLIKRS